jgi:hypothetical protein
VTRSPPWDGIVAVTKNTKFDTCRSNGLAKAPRHRMMDLPVCLTSRGLSLCVAWPSNLDANIPVHSNVRSLPSRRVRYNRSWTVFRCYAASSIMPCDSIPSKCQTICRNIRFRRHPHEVSNPISSTQVHLPLMGPQTITPLLRTIF